MAQVPDEQLADRSSDKLQSAIYYAIDGDQVETFVLVGFLQRIRIGIAICGPHSVEESRNAVVVLVKNRVESRNRKENH